MSEKWGKLTAFGFACFFCMWTFLLAAAIANPFVGKDAFAFPRTHGTAVRDFVLFYQAGYMLNAGERENLYITDVQRQYTNRLIAPHRLDSVFIFHSPPFMFPMMAPLAVLSLPSAYLAWYCLSLAAGVFAITLLVLDEKRFSKIDLFLFVFAIASSAPSMITLALGQTSWLIFSFVCFAYLGLKGKKDLLAALSLALLTLKFQYLPLLGVSVIALKRWKVILFAVVSEIALLSLAGFTAGWSNVLNYPSIVFRGETSTTYSGVNASGMVSIRGLLSSLVPAQAVMPTNAIVLACAAILTFILWRRVLQNRLSIQWAMALSTVLSIFASPHSHAHDLMLMALPAILTLPNLSPVKIAKLPSLAQRFWCLTFLLYPLLSWIIFCAQLPWLFTGLNFFLLICGFLYVFRETEHSSVVEQSGP